MRAWTLGLAAVVASGAAAQAQPLTREELLQALKARDAQISALQAQVGALQARIGALEHSAAPATAGPAPVASAPAAAPPSTTTAAAAKPPSAPAEDEEALHALSRTLVERGGQLLPAWSAEVIPGFAYSNRIVQGLALAPTPEGIPTVSDQRLRIDQIRASAGFRLGLPWASQVDVTVPYAWIRQSRSLGDGTHGVNEDSGIGDVSLELSHEFLRESGWRPDLVAGVSYRFPTGRDPFRIPIPSIATGAGQGELRVRATAVKSAEPLVFFGTLSYAHDFAVEEPAGRVQPGDAINLDLGTVVALSPDTSLTFALSQEFRSRSNFNGVGAPGTDTTASVLQIGLGQVLTPRILLDLNVGVGLSHDAPDYTVQVSLPIRLR